MAARSERPSRPIAGQRRRERGSAAHRLLKLHQEKIIKGDCVFVMAARCVRPKEQGVGGLTSALAWVRGGALLIFWKGLEGPAAAWDRGGGPPARRWGGRGGLVPLSLFHTLSTLPSSPPVTEVVGSSAAQWVRNWACDLTLTGPGRHCTLPAPSPHTLTWARENCPLAKRRKKKKSRVPECRVGAGEEADRNRPDELQSESGAPDQEQLSGPRGRISLSSPPVAFISHGSACLF